MKKHLFLLAVLTMATPLCAEDPNCLKASDPGFQAWNDFGEPDCWCYSYQCRGDIIGGDGGGLFPVDMHDLNVMRHAFNQKDDDLKQIPDGICADLNHKSYCNRRVSDNDLDEFKLYYFLIGAQIPVCSDEHINFWVRSPSVSIADIRLSVHEGNKLDIVVDAGGFPFSDYFMLIAPIDEASISGGIVAIPEAPDASSLLGDNASEHALNPPGFDGPLGYIGDFILEPPYGAGIYFMDFQIDFMEGVSQTNVELWRIQDPNSSTTLLATISLYNNDDCIDAIPIETNVPFYGSTDGATGTSTSSCGINDANDVWHSFTADLTAEYTVSLCGSSFDTTLSVFDGCGGTELACNDNTTLNVCPLTEQSQIQMTMKQGVTYFIRLAGQNFQTGEYTLTVTGPKCTSPITSDLNNDCQVNLLDLAIFALEWLDCNIEPEEECFN